MQDLTLEMKENVDTWYSDIKKQLTSKAQENYLKRLQEIINIANQVLSQYNTGLIITDSDKLKMWDGIASDIDNWKGVEIMACTKIKTNYKSYAITSRNWWNRNKAKVYGNHFFYPIIFCYIYNECMKLSNLPKQEKMYVFVDVFDEILHAKIQFPQTRAQPIIPHQSFIQPNKFKYSSIDLLKQYGVIWNGKNILNTNNNNNNNTNNTTDNDNIYRNINNSSSPQQPRQSYYVKDKDRSLKVNKSYIDCLDSLKQRLALLKSQSNTNQLPPNIKQERANVTSSITNKNECDTNHSKIKIKTHPKMLDIPSLNTTLPLLSVVNISNGITNIQMNGMGNTNPNVPNIPSINIPPPSATSTSTTTTINSTSPISMLSDLSLPSINNDNNIILPPNMIPNINLPNINGYSAYHGQSNSVINQRYSPLQAIPINNNINALNAVNNLANLGNLNNLYCSIRTDPVSGKLVLSLHIPLDS